MRRIVYEYVANGEKAPRFARGNFVPPSGSRRRESPGGYEPRTWQLEDQILAEAHLNNKVCFTSSLVGVNTVRKQKKLETKKT
jgi:hypothetical protein